MSEQCQKCGKNYETIYRVPNDVWDKICPEKNTLGPHKEHQFGGLLCVDCAFSEAYNLGIVLYFSASADDWPENKRSGHA